MLPNIKKLKVTLNIVTSKLTVFIQVKNVITIHKTNLYSSTDANHGLNKAEMAI